MPAKTTKNTKNTAETTAPKKTTKQQNVVATPVAVVETEPVAVVETEPVAAKRRRNVKKNVVAETEPVAVAVAETVAVVETVAETEPVTAKRRRTVKKNVVAESVAVTESVAETEPVTVQEEQVHSRQNRSFKVCLPGTETFEGRFTGLTPYQAANKALSKYFRDLENKDQEDEITFAICESTRKSKKTTYNYIGRRQKLATPVTYTIKGIDGNAKVITKNFKNTLKKVKKTEAVVAPTETA